MHRKKLLVTSKFYAQWFLTLLCKNLPKDLEFSAILFIFATDSWQNCQKSVMKTVNNEVKYLKNMKIERNTYMQQLIDSKDNGTRTFLSFGPSPGDIKLFGFSYK